MRICVYGGSNGFHPRYLAAARRVGRGLARSGMSLVYGGASVGLMGAVADAVLFEGGDGKTPPSGAPRPVVLADSIEPILETIENHAPTTVGKWMAHPPRPYAAAKGAAITHTASKWSSGYDPSQG